MSGTQTCFDHEQRMAPRPEAKRLHINLSREGPSLHDVSLYNRLNIGSDKQPT